MNDKKTNTAYFVKLAVLLAVMGILMFTPLGMLRIGPVEMTFLQIPVIIAGIVLGPAAGLFTGLCFGLYSLSQAPVSAIFAPAFASNPLIVAVVCIVPRLLVGLIPGLLSKPLRKMNKLRPVGYAVTGVIGSLINTVLFIGGVVLLLSSLISGTMDELGLLTGKTLIAFWAGIGVTNGIPEAAATGLLVSAIGTALDKAYKR